MMILLSYPSNPMSLINQINQRLHRVSPSTDLSLDISQVKIARSVDLIAGCNDRYLNEKVTL
jgi:hypothetical protein